ncbi:MAG: UDP-N-acetylmuramate--L-alanine ligase [Candidatus Staskawiczbacteria bacterium]|nr:UDP-N-acetylmuramate--L-alanine ligase [Candidatus Staskawiczbacteria bacterium]
MKIHFIGIGGIGVSALAQYYLEKGHEISGSDIVASEITSAMAKKGMRVAIGNAPQNISKDFDQVIYSPAIKPGNFEYEEAKRLGVTLKSYPEALGELTKQYITIAVSGSHGKSTTTAMVALILIKAGIDPTVIVGTKLREFNDSNFRMGKSKYLVIEACEYDGSFLNYRPTIAVITNIDKEHLDYFKNFANVIKEFKKFITKLPKDGFLVANKEDKNLVKIAKGEFTTKFYSTKQKDSTKLKKSLKIPGQHNVSNALASLEVARILGVKDSVSFKSLSEYKGSWRRFDVKEGKVGTKRITVVGDYGHHPTEVAATLKAAREKYPKKKIWCILQPHQHQRTYYLFNDFVKLFKSIKIDNIIITDIYDVAGREEKNINEKVDSQLLVKKIAKKNTQYMTIDSAEKFVKENIKSGEVLIIMGAGDVYKLADKF